MVEIVKQNYEENINSFISIKKQLRNCLNNKVHIEHVGSTAIPNMYGKNIIDILIGAKDIDEFNYIKKRLEENHFYASEKSKDDIYQFFASTTDETKSGDVHIHLVIKETQRYNDFIILKNYLLKNKKKAREYSDFKMELIANNIYEREEYKKLKSEYVSNLLRRARDVK